MITTSLNVVAIADKLRHLIGTKNAAKVIADVIAWKIKQRWRRHSGKMYVGNVPCAICETGTIRCRLDFKTGKLRAKCTTDNCFAVIE